VVITSKNMPFDLNLAEKPIIIVGIVKNIEKSIQKDMAKLSRAFSMFKEIHWYLVENWLKLSLIIKILTFNQ
jgi:hypothetical protein